MPGKKGKFAKAATRTATATTTIKVKKARAKNSRKFHFIRSEIRITFPVNIFCHTLLQKWSDNAAAAAVAAAARPLRRKHRHTHTHLHIRGSERESATNWSDSIGWGISNYATSTPAAATRTTSPTTVPTTAAWKEMKRQRRRGGKRVRFAQNSLQQMKIPRIFAFAVSFGFCGCQSLFTWLSRVIYGLQIFRSSLCLRFFFYFLAIFVFFVVIVFVHCWLVAKREICVAKLHIFIVITRC